MEVSQERNAGNGGALRGASLTKPQQNTIGAGRDRWPAPRLTARLGSRGIVREFRFRYKFKRQTGVITLSNFPGLSLADARASAQRFRDLLKEGIDL